MSLRVEGHSRGRSRSPGRKDERSRSRDVRAPSPSVQVVIKSDHKKGGESDSDGRSKKKHGKKHQSSDSESESRSKHKKSSKKRYDSESSSDSDSRSKRHSSRKHRSDSDSGHKSRRHNSKKYVDSDSDSASTSGSSSSEDDRRSKHKSSHKSKKGHHDSKQSHSGHSKNDKHAEKGDKVIIMPGSYAPPPQYVIAQPEGKHAKGTKYAQVQQYQYAEQPDRKLSYSAQPQFVEAKPHDRRSSNTSKHRLSVTEDDSDLSDLSPLDGDSDSDSGGSDLLALRKKTKKVSFYDPEHDAMALAAALKHSTVDPKPIIKILPHLSDENIMMLRTEYKKHMKAQGKGVNIAKHVKMKVTGNLGKAAYAVALGRWESEAHWANFWYQSDSSRRELLIESLMGRSNSEIVKIKEAFSDQRYHNSLERCMQTELKKDKFRTAVLLVLEEKRMSESQKVDMSLVKKDVEILHKALTAKEGGETAMINIIVLRSDKHLIEILKVFEALYKKNFAREMIKRSQNLVGETLAHILNGVLNRPVRDALLLHQALTETSKDRHELLISRLVRFHWEPKHLERIKVAYKQRYGSSLEKDVVEENKGDFAHFVRELCRANE